MGKYYKKQNAKSALLTWGSPLLASTCLAGFLAHGGARMNEIHSLKVPKEQRGKTMCLKCVAHYPGTQVTQAQSMPVQNLLVVQFPKQTVL